MSASGLLIIGCILLCLAIHPFTTYPLSLYLLYRLRGGRPLKLRTDAAPIRLAVCTCAYNEESRIETKIKNLLALRQHSPTLEIYLYVDGASDRTAEIAARYGDLIHLHVSADRRGKTHGMNHLVAQTSADILIFTDANVLLDHQALVRLVPYFSDPDVGCVCGNLNYTNAGESVTSSTGSMYWRLEESLKRLESGLDSMMGADGSLFAIRRSLHREPPDHIIDDMFVSFGVLCQGYRVVQVSDVRAFEESIPVSSEEFGRKIRIACQAFNVHRLIWPQLRRLNGLLLYMYVSHKLLRWFSIFLFGAAMCFIFLGLLLAGWPAVAIAMVGSVGLILGAGYLGHVPVCSQLTDVFLALLGTGIGVWCSLRGEVYQTWNPAASIRR
ncbi:MAG: glycosyltransferase [Burkholderiaceae bacterium]